jgi:hypothetical protein
MARELIEAFQGPKGEAQVYEIASTNSIGVEKVEYEIDFGGEIRKARTMGEASILACELSGNPRFLHPSG